MEFIAWRDTYNLGDILIDTHHRIFFEMVRDLTNTHHDGGQKLDASEVLEFLIEYIAMHFSAEESLMTSIGYPDLAAHKKVHADFTQRVDKINRELQQNPSALTLEELLSLAQSWFLEHILEEDMKIKSRLSETTA